LNTGWDPVEWQTKYIPNFVLFLLQKINPQTSLIKFIIDLASFLSCNTSKYKLAPIYRKEIKMLFLYRKVCIMDPYRT